MREKKRKYQTRTQDVTEFGLKCIRLRNYQPLTIEVELKHYKIVLHLYNLVPYTQMGCQTYQ
jgi:hypothetical protein